MKIFRFIRTLRNHDRSVLGAMSCNLEIDKNKKPAF